MSTVLVVVAVLAAVLFLLRGRPELFRLKVENGKVASVSGRVPPRLLSDFTDVLSDPAIARADVRVVVEGGVPKVMATGLEEGRLQQLRNVLGTYPVAQIRAGRRASGRRRPRG